MFEWCEDVDYGAAFLDEIHRQRHSVIKMCGTCELDPTTTCWVIKASAWERFMHTEEFLLMGLSYATSLEGMASQGLMGLPIRFTVHDPSEMPDIVLMMEPQLLNLRQSGEVIVMHAGDLSRRSRSK